MTEAKAHEDLAAADYRERQRTQHRADIARALGVQTAMPGTGELRATWTAEVRRGVYPSVTVATEQEYVNMTLQSLPPEVAVRIAEVLRPLGFH